MTLKLQNISILAIFMASTCALTLAMCVSSNGQIEVNADKEGSGRIYNVNGFELSVGHDVEVRSNSPVEDFILYTFLVDNSEFLHAYSGNHPRFPTSTEKKMEIQKVHFGELQGECVGWQSGLDAFGRECLMHLNNSEDWPQYVHFWYDLLSSRDKERADAIIQSIRKSR